MSETGYYCKVCRIVWTSYDAAREHESDEHLKFIETVELRAW